MASNNISGFISNIGTINGSVSIASTSVNGNVVKGDEIVGDIRATILKGMSAYELAVKNGFEGTELEWLQSLVGEKGEDGHIGVDGFSPIINIREIERGYEISIQDKPDTEPTIFNIYNGKNAVWVGSDPMPDDYDIWIDPDGDVYLDVYTKKEIDELLKTKGGQIQPATKNTLGGIIVGDNLEVSPEGVLNVSTVDEVIEDNTKPITSAGVYKELGNIEALLGTI